MLFEDPRETGRGSVEEGVGWWWKGDGIWLDAIADVAHEHLLTPSAGHSQPLLPSLSHRSLSPALSTVKEFTKETKSNPATGLYGAIGVFTAALPIYIFVFILHVDLESNAIVMGIVSIAAAFALQKSYDNVANTLKPVLEKTVKAAVTEKVNAQKDTTKEQRTELIRKKTIAAADEQASALAIFKNNATFFFTLMVLVFVLFVNLTLTTNYVLSVGISSGLTLLLSS